MIEYCDLGNLSTGLKNRVFFCDHNGKLLTQLADAAANGRPDVSLSTQDATGAGALERGAGARINLHALLLTLIEIGSALSYLHRMGVVHCDIKPANVLLKSSNHDPRGFTVKVSGWRGEQRGNRDSGMEREMGKGGGRKGRRGGGEIGSALSYLHRMGVVHCDIKPANVLLKSSNHDPRGFTVKVSGWRGAWGRGKGGNGEGGRGMRLVVR